MLRIDVVRLAGTWRDLAPDIATVKLVRHISSVNGQFAFGRRYEAVLAVLDLPGIGRDTVVCARAGVEILRYWSKPVG